MMVAKDFYVGKSGLPIANVARYDGIMFHTLTVEFWAL